MIEIKSGAICYVFFLCLGSAFYIHAPQFLDMGSEKDLYLAALSALSPLFFILSAYACIVYDLER